MIKLAPSILSADFSRLGDELRAVAEAGAHYAHIDVMDGHFVPNITIGPPVIASLRPVSGLVFDVHLMISEPERYVVRFAEAGADIICFHMEAAKDPAWLIRAIRGSGKKPAAAIKPGTPVDTVLPFARDLDMILVMSVEPGFGGQTLIRPTLDKARILRDYIDRNGIGCDIEMDGGVKQSNAVEVLSAGVNVLVAGTDIFGQKDVGEKTRRFLGFVNEWERNKASSR